MTRLVRVEQTRAEFICKGDVVRPLEWSDRRPAFRQVAEARLTDGPEGELVYLTWGDGSSECMSPFDLYEIQVTVDPKPRPMESR